MEEQKYIFEWGTLKNKNRVFGFRTFMVYFRNPLPKIFNTLCWWRFKGSRIKHLHILGFHFIGFRDKK